MPKAYTTGLGRSNEHFSSGAAEHHQYDSKPWQKELIKQIMADLRSHMDWMRVSWAQKTDTNGKLATTALDPRLGEVKMLDYACGLGVASEVNTVIPEVPP